MRIFWFPWAVVLMMALTTQYSTADVLDSMEKALMPGELSDAHAEFEDKCTDCHKFFKQSSQNTLCLDCHDHKNIKKDLKTKTGFHGRIPDVKKKDCKVCHREHLGRKADIVLFDKQTFDHGLTDFPLRGTHKEVQCQACHKPKKKYYEAKSKCIDCHEKEEPHKEKLGKVCNSCHRETNWNDFQFDHSKTKFELVGKHKGVECRDCHPQERYFSLPKKCYSCHKNDDKHKGRYGKKCKECHIPSGWTEEKFDHDKTDFKLTGRHKKVACDQCHKKGENPFKEELKTDCFSCHKFVDEHKGSYGKKCKDCHTTKQWDKTKFDHDKTDFALKGKHKKVSCRDCHPGHLYKDKVSVKCYSCHKPHDVHQGEHGKVCKDCHNEKGWSNDVEFDHNLARFPLLGSHAALACEECHSSSDFREAEFRCHACHKSDDVHKAKLGPRCGLCHVSNDFKAWDFNHDKRTDFPLKGAHKSKDCLICHRDPVRKHDELSLPSSCGGCHAEDDVHDGGFGRACDRCHNQTDFEEIQMDAMK